MFHIAYVSAWVDRYVQVSAGVLGDQSVGSPGAAVTGGCELPRVGTKNRAQVLWKNSVYFPPLNHLSSPRKETCFYTLVPYVARWQRPDCTADAIDPDNHLPVTSRE